MNLAEKRRKLKELKGWGILTKKQYKRFNLRYLTSPPTPFRHIARREDVSHVAILKSVSQAEEKLKKYKKKLSW